MGELYDVRYTYSLLLMLSWLDIRRRIQLIQDFEMPTVSNCISISNDGRFIFATGKS